MLESMGASRLGVGEQGGDLSPGWLRDMALIWGRIVGMAWGRRYSHPCPEPSPRLWQGQTCWRSTWWRSAACASASRSPSALTTGSGSSSNTAWPPPARPAVWCCTGARAAREPCALGGGQPLHTPLHGEGTHPVHDGVSGERLSTGAPFAGLPSDVYAQGPEPGLQLSGENQALREDNRTLRLQRDHLSQGRVRPPASRV